MQIVRQRVGGLGLSVKGGQEHNLPVLISRIFKDQAGTYTTRPHPTHLQGPGRYVHNQSASHSSSRTRPVRTQLVLISRIFKDQAGTYTTRPHPMHLQGPGRYVHNPSSFHASSRTRPVRTQPVLISRIFNDQAGTSPLSLFIIVQLNLTELPSQVPIVLGSQDSARKSRLIDCPVVRMSTSKIYQIL